MLPRVAVERGACSTGPIPRCLVAASKNSLGRSAFRIIFNPASRSNSRAARAVEGDRRSGQISPVPSSRERATSGCNKRERSDASGPPSHMLRACSPLRAPLSGFLFWRAPGFSPPPSLTPASSTSSIRSCRGGDRHGPVHLRHFPIERSIAARQLEIWVERPQRVLSIGSRWQLSHGAAMGPGDHLQ